RILFDLLSKLVDEYSQVLDFIAVIRTPYRLQQLRVRDRNIRMRHHILQQLELFRRQTSLAISNDDPPQVEVDLDIIESQNLQLVRNLRQPPKRRTDTREEFGRAERLRNVIVGTGIEGFDFVRFRVTYGKHNHRSVRS